MKALLNLKMADLAVQVLAVIIPGIMGCYFLDYRYWGQIYFYVGGVQLISCLVNLGLNKKLRSSRRKYYELAMGCVVGMLLLTWMLVYANEFMMIIMLALLVISPIMAIYYFALSYQEYNTIRRYVERNKYVLTN